MFLQTVVKMDIFTVTVNKLSMREQTLDFIDVLQHSSNPCQLPGSWQWCNPGEATPIKKAYCNLDNKVNNIDVTNYIIHVIIYIAI